MVDASFAEFVQSLFPGVNPETAKQCIQDLTNDPPEPRELFALTLPNDIYQGDMLEPVDFLGYGADGGYVESSLVGMLMSHSCDMAEDQKVIFAACHPADRYHAHSAWGQIRRNRFYELMYLAGVPTKGDVIVDLATVQTVPTSRIRDQLAENNLTRISSFTPIGYYFFVAKLTVHFLRAREDDEVRNPPPVRGLFRRAVATVKRKVRGVSARFGLLSFV
jgi:hypothetical protein